MSEPMSLDAIKAVLLAHERWRFGVAAGVRADLGGADLRGANLRGVDLVGANLRGANLRGADLGDANLVDADLRGADLGGANLRGANLGDANLVDADLRGADLRGANLGDADLGDANLVDADLRGADLMGADLGGANLVFANLSGANLRGADLRGANLVGAKGVAPIIAARLSACPETGAFVAWKKLRDGRVARLLVPADSRRSSATSRKCRAEAVYVEAIFAGSGEAVVDGLSLRSDGVPLAYRVGERVTCDAWDPNRWVECSGGIHFFITRAEAEEFVL